MRHWRRWLRSLPEVRRRWAPELNVTHLKPSGLGAEITATAILTAVEGRKLTFNVGARDAAGMIGEGTHVRYIVDRAKFLAKWADAVAGASERCRPDSDTRGKRAVICGFGERGLDL